MKWSQFWTPQQARRLLKFALKPILHKKTLDYRVWFELQDHSPLSVVILANLLPPSKRISKDIHPSLCLCASILMLHGKKMRHAVILKTSYAIGLTVEQTIYVYTLYNVKDGRSNTLTAKVCS